MQRFRNTIILCLTALAVVLCGAAPAIASSVLTPSVASLEFGSTEVHSGSFPQQGVSFVNESLAGANVEAVEVTGPDAAEFSIPQNSCSGEVLPTMSCGLEVRFQPQSPGAKSATLALVESGGTVEVSLSGTGRTGTLSAEASNFPLTVVGRSESTQVTVDNAEAGTHVDSVEIAGPDASSFSIDNGNCAGNTFGPGNTCSVGLRFSPSSAGQKTAQLVITSDASNSPLIVPLSGVGAEGPRLSVDPQQALLGDVAIGSSVEQTFTLTNTGDYPLGVQGAFVVSGTPLMFPVTGQTCAGRYLEPAASCTITIAFKPTALGQKDASVILITSSENGVSAVGLEGVGAPADSSPASVTAPIAEAPTALSPVLIAPPPSVSPVVALDVHPRLFALSRPRTRFTVNTGIGALCPTGVTLCRVHTILTTTVASRHARGARSAGVRTPVLLGSTVTTLRGGQRAVVRGQLSYSGLALLERRRRLRVSVMVAIAAPGVPTVMQWRTLTLTAKVAPVIEN